jgi:hypothetical protein
MYDWFKSLLGIRILIRLDPDLFGQIRILERAMAVYGAIFLSTDTFRIRVVTKSKNPQFYIYCCDTVRAVRDGEFLNGKKVLKEP